VQFARDHLAAKLIIDPFCGVGTVLAVANALHISALGIERSTTRSRQAQTLTVRSDEL
jgi:tRNA G10  N-methylase Trm11